MDDISVPIVTTYDDKKRLTFKRSLSDPKTENYSVSLRRMRWFFAIALSIWTLASMIAPALIFYQVKNPLAFSLFSALAPPIFLWLRFAKYLFPMDEKTFELEKLKIEAKKQSTNIFKQAKR